MLRYLSMCAVILVLAAPSLGNAQTSEAPGLGERFKSLFTFGKKPESPIAKKELKSPGRLPQKMPTQPVQVTTRSGSLRQTGPENAAAAQPARTPTFAPAEVPLPKQAPRRLEVPSARQLPLADAPPKQMRIRDSAVSPAAYETRPEKQTTAGWFRELWPWKEKPVPQKPIRLSSETQTGAAMKPRSRDESSSIDPNRVYRGPKTDPNQGRGPSAGRGSRFSETGVPTSTSDFRGRQGTSY